MKTTITTFAAILLAITTMAFNADDKKAAAQKVADKKVAPAKSKKKEICCESGIPNRFAAAGAKVLKKDKPVAAPHK